MKTADYLNHFCSFLVGIIVAVLLAAVIVLLVRRKQNKPMVPPAVRGAGSRIRDRFSRMSRSSPITNAGKWSQNVMVT